jgi:predicted nucleotidyltransferase
MTSPSAAFLSVRLPPAVRDRLKASAAARGETVQGLVGSLVQRFLAEESPAPELARVLTVLRAQEAYLTQRGITSLWIFGSVARGEAHPGSDVDLLATFDPQAKLSLVGLASLRAELSELLGVPADLVADDALHPAIRAQAEQEAVRVL